MTRVSLTKLTLGLSLALTLVVGGAASAGDDKCTVATSGDSPVAAGLCQGRPRRGQEAHEGRGEDRRGQRQEVHLRGLPQGSGELRADPEREGRLPEADGRAEEVVSLSAFRYAKPRRSVAAAGVFLLRARCPIGRRRPKWPPEPLPRNAKNPGAA